MDRQAMELMVDRVARGVGRGRQAQDVEVPSERDARQIGRDIGRSVASWVDVPEIGTRLRGDVDWRGIGVIEDEDDQREAFEMVAEEMVWDGDVAKGVRERLKWEYDYGDVDELDDVVDEFLHGDLDEAFREGVQDGIEDDMKRRRFGRRRGAAMRLPITVARIAPDWDNRSATIRMGGKMYEVTTKRKRNLGRMHSDYAGIYVHTIDPVQKKVAFALKDVKVGDPVLSVKDGETEDAAALLDHGTGKRGARR